MEATGAVLEPVRPLDETHERVRGTDLEEGGRKGTWRPPIAVACPADARTRKRRDGAGHKRITDDTPKSGRSRVVPLTEALRQALHEHAVPRGIHVLAARQDAIDLLNARAE